VTSTSRQLRGSSTRCWSPKRQSVPQTFRGAIAQGNAKLPGITLWQRRQPY
jgi:hypothetical protein